MLSSGLSYPLTILLDTQCQHRSALTYTRPVVTPRLHFSRRIFPPISLSTNRLMGRVTPLAWNTISLNSCLLRWTSSALRKLLTAAQSEGNWSLYITSLWRSVMRTSELTFLCVAQFLMFSPGGSQTTQTDCFSQGDGGRWYGGCSIFFFFFWNWE